MAKRVYLRELSRPHTKVTLQHVARFGWEKLVLNKYETNFFFCFDPFFPYVELDFPLIASVCDLL